MSLWPIPFVLIAASLLPMQAAMTGALNRALGKPVLAVAVSMSGSLLCIATFAALAGRLRDFEWRRAGDVPWWTWPAGVGGAVFLLSQPTVLPKVGAATSTGLTVTAQVPMAVALDQFGALGLPHHPASPVRLAGAPRRGGADGRGVRPDLAR